ncbi:amino acid/polyamine transporter I [Suillus fuscotomentosus]|uniref:Amino acid/polyamine transporter I n=1 Tax=Suillus fuscotomentosus TaxID=1912939 RepID=A0AAD4HDJ4_9AGAM|nr:amino acid/polyamine transporter I [Suillus fuscotomentosus]KAG1893655.1 amino acid/polyamine transporter I [Suillus fuscotomentosus]
MASTSSDPHSGHTGDEAILAGLGYKQEFQRQFTPLEVFGVAFSIVGLLPSISSVLFNVMPNGGPLAMVWGWVFASAFIMCIGLAMAELASAAPTSGGLYYWTHSLASPRCRNFLSWIVGYANTITSIAGLASVDWACAIQITAAVSIASNQVYVTSNAQIYGIFAALVLSHAVLVSLGTQILARLQRLYILLNVCLCFVVIIALPIATPSEFRNSASYALGDFTNFNGWPSGFAFILSLLAPLWTIGGYDSSVHMSEEASNATTAIPWAIVGSIAISAALGWGINVSLAFCMGSDIEGILESPIGQPMAQIFYNSFGQKGALALWSLVIVAQYMMGSSCLLVGSRQTFAFARDGGLPFSRYFYRINSYTTTPVNTVWLDAFLALAMGLLAFASTQAINAIFTLGVTSSYVSYIIPIMTRFAFKNDFKPGPFNLGKFSFPVAAIAVLWMVFMNIVFFFPTTPQTNVQEMNYTVVVLGGFMSLAIFWYYCPVYGGVHWFNGPVSNIASADKGQDDESASEKTGKEQGVDVLIVDA